MCISVICSVTSSNSSKLQEKLLFSLEGPLSNKKIEMDFSSPDISSNGGLALLGSMKGSFTEKIASCTTLLNVSALEKIDMKELLTLTELLNQNQNVIERNLFDF